jgi:HD-like signal output (HDOD) protein/CheY-like chemotaxis protein
MLTRSILCVSDKADVQKRCKAVFEPLASFWELSFATSLKTAMYWLDNNNFDLVIVDVRMPNREGLALLNAIMRGTPSVNRVALADETGEQYLKNTTDLVHQSVLVRMIDTHLLPAVKRAFTISDICESDEIRKLVLEIKRLPSLPTIYSELLHILNDDDASVSKVGKLISQDIAMTAKVLALVNSAFFGLCRRVYTVEEAAVYIGMEPLKTLVLSYQAFAALSAEGIPKRYIEELWKHSVTVASFARCIASSETNDKNEINIAFTAGMMHDIGRLVLMDNLTERYRRYLECLTHDDIPEIKLEKLIFGATHQEIGALLLRKWGLPNTIVDPILFHHDPLKSGHDFSPTIAVAVADCMYYDLVGAPQEVIKRRLPLDLDQFSAVKSRHWKDVCQETMKGGK